MIPIGDEPVGKSSSYTPSTLTPGKLAKPSSSQSWIQLLHMENAGKSKHTGEVEDVADIDHK